MKKIKVYQAVKRILNAANQYYVLNPSPGIFQPIRRISPDDDIVQIEPLEAVAAVIAKYSEDLFSQAEDYQLVPRDATEAAKYWAMTTAPVPRPKMFSFPGEEGLSFSRLPWRPAEGECPTWDKILGRMSNAKAFMAWIGSLFDENSYLQQYVWLHGKGNDGKGSINRFLSRVFATAYCSKQPKERGDKFWAYELLGKRLVVFPDCNDINFVTAGFFKALTGGDPIGIEAKGKMSYTIRLNCKFLILSNERPALSSETADRRRAIYCELESRDEQDEDVAFEEKLWAEGGHFLHKCAQEYANTNPGMPIDVDGDELEDIIEANEANFAEIFYFNFEINMEDRANWLQPVYLQQRLKCLFNNQREIREFLSYLERVHLVRKLTVRYGSDTIKQYVGLVGKPLKVV